MLIDGKKIAEKAKLRIKREIEACLITPALAMIRVGENTASEIYMRNKARACDEVGIRSETHVFEKMTGEELIAFIQKLNADPNVHGILVQLPLPEYLDEKKILAAISPRKDVDGLTPVNYGNFLKGDETVAPCTPKGVIRILEEQKIRIAGTHAVVVGRSNIAGKPIAIMLLKRDATVTICHSKTKKLQEYTRKADILVAAAGKAGLIKKNMVKKGAAVIDVGINRKGTKVLGDVEPEVEKVAKYLTPVPGGVGPMTIAMLLENTLNACKRLEGTS